MKKLILIHIFLLILNGISNAQTDVINIIPSGNVGISSTAPVSSLEVSGSYGQKVTTITSNTTLDATYNTVVCNNGSTAIAVTLPTASTCTGRIYVIKRNAASTANVTITPTPTLDGVASFVLTMSNQSIEVFSDGAEWKTRVGGLSANATAWNLNGNSGTTASTSPIGTAANNNYIGTTDAKDFVMTTTNLERMRILAGGNVGIGTSTPNGKLAVVDGGLNTHAMQIIHTNATNSNGLNIQTQTNIAADFALRVVPNAGATEAFIVRNTGNVGLGSTSPGRRLDVAGYGTGNYEAKIGSGAVAQSATLDIIANHDAIGLQVWDDNNLTTPRFVVMRGGNVGVATTAPAYFLQVGQNTATNNTDYSAGVLRHGTSVTPGTYTANVPAFIVQDYAADGPASFETTGMVNIATPRIADADANAANALLLSVSNDNGYALTVKGNRNVGIGTSAPAQRLEVSGNARVTGLASGGSGAIVKTNSSGDLSVTNFSGSGSDVLTGAGTFVGISTISGDDWTQTGSLLYPNNTGWNVGIGNTSPSFKLDVTGTARIGATGGVAIYSADANTVNFRPSVSNGDILITDDSGSLLRGITVANGGNIGVGTDAPAQKLEVAGGARITGLASGGSGAIVKTNSSGDLSVTNFSGSGTDVLTGAGTFVGISTISGDDWTQSGSNLYPNNTGWNVGVGTTSPTAKLHVTSDVSVTGTKGITFQGSVAESNNNGRAISVLRNSGTEVLGVNNEGIITGYTTAGANTVFIDPRTNQHLWFNTGGNLGVGNNAPGFRLDVTGNARIGNTGGVVVASIDANTVNFRPSISNGDILISDDSGTPARGLTVANGGSVGIGTDVPASKLHILGGGYPQAIIDQAGGHAILDIRTTDATAFEQGIRFYRNGVHQAEIYTINGDQKLRLYVNGADRMLLDNAGNINIPGLTASSAVYTDGSKNLTSTAPATGTLGFWTRSGTSLRNTNTGDNVSIGDGTFYGDSRFSIAGTNGSNDAAITMEKRDGSTNPVFSILPWDGQVYLSAGTYYSNGGWVQNCDDNNNQLFVMDPGGGMRWYASNNGSGSWNVASNEQLWDDNGYWTNLVRSTRSGNSYFTGGNLGVGSSSPGYVLDVQGASGLRIGNGTYDANLVFGNNASWKSGIRTYDNGEVEMRIWTNQPSGEVVITNGYNGDQSAVLPTDGLWVKNNNVGIGNFSSAAMGAKLDVQAATGVRIGYNNYDANLVFGNVSTWKSGIRVYDNGVAEMRIWHVNSSGKIFMSTGYNGDQATTLPTDGLVVASNSVGIGTMTPAEKLHVNGNLRVSNSLFQTDQTGSIELGGTNSIAGGGTPYMDFHYSGITQDYNLRIINNANNVWEFGSAAATLGRYGHDSYITGPGSGVRGDFMTYAYYSYWRGYWLDVVNDLDAIDNIRPITKYSEKLGRNIQEIDPASLPEVVTGRGHGIKAENAEEDPLNMSSAISLAWGGIRQLRAETKSKDYALEARVERLENLVSQLTGEKLGEMEFTASSTAYKGMEYYVIMDSRITPASVIEVKGLTDFIIEKQEEGSFTLKFTSPPLQDVKFTYSAKF